MLKTPPRPSAHSHGLARPPRPGRPARADDDRMPGGSPSPTIGFDTTPASTAPFDAVGASTSGGSPPETRALRPEETSRSRSAPIDAFPPDSRERRRRDVIVSGNDDTERHMSCSPPPGAVISVRTFARSMMILLASAILAPSAGADAGYLLVNPWHPGHPDCRVAPPDGAVGLGGACFAVPSDADTFRVTLTDTVRGPGYGFLNLCEGGGCVAVPICEGVAEGDVPPGTTHATVATADPWAAWTFCGVAAATWTPVHGTITLTFAST